MFLVCLSLIANTCQVFFCLQLNLTFSHSSGHFQVFLLIKEWECGLLSSPLYLTLLWERKKWCSSLRLQSRGKNSGAKQMLWFYFPFQPQDTMHIYWTTFLNIASYIIPVRHCLASKQLLYISHCSVLGRWRATETSSNHWYQFLFFSVTVISTGQGTKASQ